MQPEAPAIDAIRAALDRYDWTAAYDAAVAATADDAADGELIELLEALAEAAWWTSRIDESNAARERLYRVHEAADDGVRAGATALKLSEMYAFRGQRAVAGAWFARARRLLADVPDGPERGALLLREAEVAHSSGELDLAAASARAALELGRDLREPNLEAESLQCLARLCIADGRPEEGLGYFDEAMLMAVEGRCSPFVTGKVYCSFMSACEELGDLHRAAEWSEAGSVWAGLHPASAFPGLCRVHRAEVLQMRGEWAQAEDEARRACAELDGVNAYNAALGFKELGEIRRRLGDLTGAEAAFRSASDLGYQPQPGLALLRLAQGRVAVAARMIQQALCEVGQDELARAKVLPAAVQIGLAADDLDPARAAADELDRIARRYPNGVIEAAAATSRGRLLLGEGDLAGAAASLRVARQRWGALAVPYEVASTQVLLGETARRAGDDEEATACFTAAAGTFERLGAALDVASLDVGPPPEEGAAPGPGVLTGREAEVLRLVATGLTNRAIAGQLCVSEKTVERHLTSTFRKLGVSSRAAASVHAVRHGLAEPAS